MNIMKRIIFAAVTATLAFTCAAQTNQIIKRTQLVHPFQL